MVGVTIDVAKILTEIDDAGSVLILDERMHGIWSLPLF